MPHGRGHRKGCGCGFCRAPAGGRHRRRGRKKRGGRRRRKR